MSHATTPLVKICGQTRLDDAQACAAAGADWLGFIFYEKSKRAVTFDAIASWLHQVPRSVKRVAVFVDAAEAGVRRIMGSGLLDLAQFHGREPATMLNTYAFPWIKAIRLHEAADLDHLDDFHTDLILLDGPDPGSGRVFDWDLALLAQKRYPQKKFILAGGLTPQSVAAAVEKIRPYAVDVASGVESAPGQKNLDLVNAFVRFAKKPTVTTPPRSSA
jgi:phosphoribosylanthranilate isomerase